MAIYREHVLPWVLHLAMKNREATRHRERIVPAARGRVLEIGIGSGLNLPFYGPDVEAVIGLDPSAKLLSMARTAARGRPFNVELIDRSAEDLPFEDQVFDSVVTTWTLCSIPDPALALAEMRRVLKPDGEVIFIEHGLSAEVPVQVWQNRLTPLWRRCAGGCHLNRPIDALIGDGGFALSHLNTGYLVKGPRPLTYHYEGRARRADIADRFDPGGTG